MPFFNFRRGGSNAASTAAPAAQTESVEVIRKRAKHRLIGSAVLVLAGVLGFPLLFDTQPRPVSVDIPIEIPGKTAVKPQVLAVPSGPAPVTAKAPVLTPDEKVADAASLSPEEEILPLKKAPVLALPVPGVVKNEDKPNPRVDLKTQVKPEIKKIEPKPDVKLQAKVEPKPAPKPSVASNDAARVNALLNDNATSPSAKAPAVERAGRVIVQVGAFADAAKAREARSKLEQAGLTTYTQIAETKDGKRIRVRVGPFATRADAEKAASKIKTLDLPVSILTL